MNITIIYTLATQNVIQGPEALASPGSLSEMQTLRFHPRYAETESAFLLDLQAVYTQIKV